jgi:restriction endonuclease S subunit
MNVFANLLKHPSRKGHNLPNDVLSTNVIIIDKSKFSEYLYITSHAMQKYSYYNDNGVTNNMIWSIVLSSLPYNTDNNIPVIISSKNVIICSKNKEIEGFGYILTQDYLSHVILLDNIENPSLSHIMFPSNSNLTNVPIALIPNDIRKKLKSF